MSICIYCALIPGPSCIRVQQSISSRTTRKVFSSLSHRRRYDRGSSRKTDAPRRRASGSGSTPQVPSARHRTLTVLHKVEALTSRVLETRQESDLRNSWNKLLARAHEDLTTTDYESGVEAKARVFVYGCDEFSGAEELVTALLEDPISSDEGQNELVRHRWKIRSDGQSNKALEIESGPSVTVDDPGHHLRIHVPSSWLQQFTVPIRLHEFAPASSPELDPPSHESSPISKYTPKQTTLYEADVPIIVCNPLTTSVSSLLNNNLPYPLNPNSILVFTSVSYSPELHAHIRALVANAQYEHLHLSAFATVAEAERDSDRNLGIRILFVDPARALDAVRILKSNPSSPIAIEKYQDHFVGSRVSTLTDALRSIFSSSSRTESPLLSLRTHTAQSIARGALQASRISLWLEEQEIVAVQSEVRALREQVEDIKANVPQQVLGAQTEDGNDKVGKAVTEAEKALKEMMDQLTWWRAAWRVDEIGQIVGTVLERNWCKRLVNDLVYHTGRLSSLQESITASTHSLLSRHSHTSTFDSPVLRNRIAQLSSSPSYPLTNRTLTEPIETRLNQLIKFPTTRLHVSAQRLVLGMSSSLMGGAGIGWAGWAGYLNVGALGWVFGSGNMAPGSAVGVGALCTVIGLRWAVGRWERAKKGWWKDWVRVGEGLGRDLRMTLDRTIREHVTIVAETACTELEKTAVKRKQALVSILGEIDDLEEELKSARAQEGPKV